MCKCSGKHTARNCPLWPDTMVTICMSYFTTVGPSKEHRNNKPPPTGRVRERSKGDTTCATPSQNPSRWHPSWLNKVCTTRKDSELEWLTNDNPKTNPITIKPKTVSHVAEQFSWVPLPSCSPPGCPFPIKSLALSAHVSPWIIRFRVFHFQFGALEGISPSSNIRTVVQESYRCCASRVTISSGP